MQFALHLYSNAVSHDDSDLHHLSEIESGELEHASDKS
jgi:hypothetical protein